ncbi:MAG: c-type cytochrome biogenesis protein CcsB [Bacteroidales bacterium]|nr:c-type cytochrome biogenesis protein CcsB [Bacteroidales bacterium]
MMKLIKSLFSPMFMGVLFIIMAVALAIATFVENDYGAAAAREMVYNAWWFNLLFGLVALNIGGQIVIFKLYRREKLTVFLFHAAFIIMIAGAAITRFTGFEGIMHIREGESTDYCLSSESYITLSLTDKSGSVVYNDATKFSIASASVEKYHRKINNDGVEGSVRLIRYIPNASESIVNSPSGRPMISMLVTRGMAARQVVFLSPGELKEVSGFRIGFDTAEECDVTVSIVDGAFRMSSQTEITSTVMGGQETSIHQAGEPVALEVMKIYTAGSTRFIPQVLSTAGVIRPIPMDASQQRTGQNAMEFEVLTGNSVYTAYLWEREADARAETVVPVGDFSLKISYGQMEEKLPFSIRLNDFILDRYPGSNSPSGYKSDVVLVDQEKGVEKPYLIYMNNILKYGGYRFFQSSYDQDEKGTVLSVNRDFAGMFVTYTGYAAMILFIVLSLFIPSSHFRKVTGKYWTSAFRKATSVIVFLVASSFLITANGQRLVVNKESAEEFGKVLVQDQKGRTKPLYTLSSDILRKVSRENSFSGYSPMQVYLGLYLDFENWQNVPMIKVSDKNLQRIVGIRSDYAAFSDIVDISSQGSYKLSGLIDEAYAKAPAARTRTDKEVIKLDERVNICYMIYTGDFMKIFPLRDGTTHWGDDEEAMVNATSREDSLFLGNIIQMYYDAVKSNNTANATEITKAISTYQERFSSYDLPRTGKVRAELMYYKMKIFERLFPAYSFLGIVMLLVLLVVVVTGKFQNNQLLKVLTYILAAGFLMHTFGLGLRWYISGHSPMSNGYESMIFISWVTLLAGFIFRKKSWFALSATGVLAGMTLMVAHLSFMDPEITALVPVLQSYWLTLHVSVITGSYGFLGLGALLGLISMILIAISNSRNKERIGATLDELAVINYKTLTLGLYFLTIGTFLGAIWANESWGRYWGWDPKETWSLITIIVYTFVTHSRIIPGMKDMYTFNVMSLFAFSSVLMTYFGVNYYLSGLHSYAGGDPVPVPVFVYVTVAALFLLAIIAYRKYLVIEKIKK